MVVTKPTLEMMEDSELVERAYSYDDERAFVVLVNRYMGYIFGIARGFLGNEEDARDAVQQIFIKAYKPRKRPRNPQKFRAWLGTIARNHLRDTLRAGKQKDEHETNSLDDPDPQVHPVSEHSECDPEAAFSYKELRRELHEAIAKIRNPNHRICASLRFEEEMSGKEIAEIMHVSKNKVDTWVSRARIEIKKGIQLEDEL